jgi:ethanolamine utilization protein EutP
MAVAQQSKWRFMIWGGIGVGKTTLLRALEGGPAPARKTQMIDYCGWAIDTPGEYSEMGKFRQHLVATASDAQLLMVVQDATCARSNFPANYFLMFPQPTIGVVTKIDAPSANIERAVAVLRQCGVMGAIFPVSAITGSGLSALRQSLQEYQVKPKGVTQNGKRTR